MRRPIGLAITAISVGGAAFLIGWMPFFGFIAGLTAVIFGIVALMQRQSKPLGITGIVLGGVAALTSLMITIVALASTDFDEIRSRPQTSAAPEVTAEPEPTSEPTPTTPRPTQTPEPTLTPTDRYGGYDSQQREFVDAADMYREQWDSASTELQQSEAIRTRDAALCGIVPGGTVDGWVGKIIEIGANNEGKAHVRIEIADNLVVQTWNNAFSDYADNTLIDPSAPFFSSLTTMEEGSLVRFSGSFVPDGAGSCLKKANLTNVFYATDPNWIMSFSDIHLQ